MIQTKLVFCLRPHTSETVRHKNKKIYDKTNVFNIYCLGKMQKRYTHNSFNQEGTKDTSHNRKNTDGKQMRFSIYFFIQQSLFEWLKKLIRHQWCSVRIYIYIYFICYLNNLNVAHYMSPFYPFHGYRLCARG